MLIRHLSVCVIVLASLIFSPKAHSAGVNDAIEIELSRAHGFIMGQNFTLDQIKTEYPELRLAALIAENNFKSRFGTAEKNIEVELATLLPQEVLDSGKKQIVSVFASQKLTIEQASQFLEEVNSRSNGEIPSPILETLLTYQFKNNPADEFLRGYQKGFRTKGHTKAKGLDFEIKYPKSWALSEGERPNIIQTFENRNGRGVVSVSISVRDLAKESGGVLSAKEVAALKSLKGSKLLASEIFSQDGLAEIAKGSNVNNIRNRHSKRVVMDGWPGVMLDFIGDADRLDLTFELYSRIYITLYKNYLMTLQCTVIKLPQESENTFNIRVSKFLPVFHAIANSLVIHSQYSSK